MASGRLVAGGRRLVLVEVELDFAAMRVVEEQLPEAAPDAGRQAAQLIGDVGPLQLLGRARQVGRGERDMVDDTGAYLVELLAVDHVQDRRIAGIEPPTGELKVRPRADFKAQQVAIELLRHLEVVAQYRKVVHALNAHAAFLLCKSTLSAALQSPTAPGLIALR